MSANVSPGRLADRSVLLAALLARVALADQLAFEELYRHTASHLYGVALRIVRNRSMAEEILQEAYVNVWHHAGTYNANRSQPLTWLTSIVRNRALDQMRRREVDTDSLTGDDDNDTDFPADAPTAVEMLVAAADADKLAYRVQTQPTRGVKMLQPAHRPTGTMATAARA